MRWPALAGDGPPQIPAPGPSYRGCAGPDARLAAALGGGPPFSPGRKRHRQPVRTGAVAACAGRLGRESHRRSASDGHQTPLARRSQKTSPAVVRVLGGQSASHALRRIPGRRISHCHGSHRGCLSSRHQGSHGTCRDAMESARGTGHAATARHSCQRRLAGLSRRSHQA